MKKIQKLGEWERFGVQIWLRIERMWALLLVIAVVAGAGGEKAYAAEASTVIEFTEEERAYIAEKKVLRLGNAVTRKPISYEENGKLKGISVELMEWIEKASGLKFEYVSVPQGHNPVDFMQKGYTDIAVGVLPINGNLANPYIALSDAYFSSSIVLAARNGTSLEAEDKLTVATNKSYKMGGYYLAKTYPDFTLQFYDDIEACMEAVKTGRSDFAMQNVYVIDEYLQHPRYKNLSILPGTVAEEKLALALSAAEDPRLLSVLNKTIAAIPETYVTQLQIDYTIAKSYKPDLTEYLLNDLPLLITVLAVLAAVITILVMLAVLAGHKKTLRIISHSKEAFENIANNINGGVITIIKDNTYVIKYANEGFCQLLGIPRENYMDGSMINQIALHPDDKENFEMVLNKAWASRCPIETELHIQNAAGEYVPVMLRGKVSVDVDNKLTVFCVLLDISKEKELSRQLEEERLMYEVLANQSSDIIFYMDCTDGSVNWPVSYLQEFGTVLSDYFMKGISFDNNVEYLEQKQQEELKKYLDDLKGSSRILDMRLELHLKNKDVWYQLFMQKLIKEEKPYRIVGKLRDIDREMRKMERLSQTAQRDALTGLYNKAAFMAVMSDMTQEERKGEAYGDALIFMDLDNFKGVNDSYGHVTGDLLLQKVAEVIQKEFRKGDIAARFGGDEFVIFVRGMMRQKIEERIKELISVLKHTYIPIPDGKMSIQASIGICLVSEEINTAEQLLEAADRAMYHVKHSGKGGYYFYEP